MTLREALGGDARRVHELVDRLLDSENSLIVSVDRWRAVTYAQGFGLSPCQLELVAADVERGVRAITTAPDMSTRRRKHSERSEEINDSGSGDRVRRHVGRTGRQRYGGVADRGGPGRLAGGDTHCAGGGAARRLLRMAHKPAAATPGAR